ncbi:hypothetical protein Zmor_018148 [Zophobas morio]|uniref:Odorant receptor n=1 Tax=Zophobas morio TaxID=2755281 RepID=A0AA38IBK4_9CUCU|nr:hypothetical protein Zmor_018148 [Zophobas morio]
MSSYNYLNFTITVLRISVLWPKDSECFEKGRFLKDSLLILSILPCALPILADFLIHLHGSVYNVAALIENFIALICIAGMVYMIICFIHKRKLIKQLVEQLPNFNFYNKPSNLMETDDKANLYAKVFLFYGVFGNIVYMIMPYLNIETCRVRQAQVDRDVPCGLVTRCWFPFNFDYSPVFEIVFVHQFYTCTMVSLIILDLTMLLCGFLMHIINQLKHLRNLIAKLNCLEAVFAKKIRFCIQYHQQIIIYSDKTNEAFSTMMMLHLTLTSLVISALGFEILIVDNFHDSLRFTLHLLGWLVLLLLICYYGQLLIDESIAIAEDIYYVPWDAASVDVRKDIYMMLMRSQKPLTLNAANMGVMSFPTFLGVISSAYSYFTLLLNIKS